MRWIKYFILSICFMLGFTGLGLAIERHLLLFAPLVEKNQTVVLEVLPNGEIRNTYQRLTTGYGSSYPGVSPDQQNILIPAPNTTTQYRIFPTALVSRLTTYEHLGQYGWSVNYHPNGKMVIFATSSIYSVRNDGLLTWINSSFGCDPRWINPCRNMFVEGGPGKTIDVRSIDTGTMTVNTTQNIDIRGDFGDAAFTPDGNQVLICKTPLPGITSDIDIFSILPDDTLDTTAQHISFPNHYSAYSIAMSADGQYAYVAFYTSDTVVTLSHTSTGEWFDTGKRLPLYDPWQIERLPVYNLVVIDHQVDVLGYSYTYYSTFFIQTDGTLLSTGYSFPFQQTFGDNPITMVFAYPPGVTEVDQQWQLYE